jgi:aryl-alcohol dehydrogenase
MATLLNETTKSPESGTDSLAITAAVVEEKGGPFELQQLELDTRLGPLDVLVEIVATGVCQTDVHVRNQDLPVPLPLVLGHEGAGIVRGVGVGVVSVIPGDHVVLSFQSCGHCAQCLRGVPTYCDSLFALNFSGARADGTTALHRGSGAQREDIHGNFFGQSSFATYSIANERSVVKVDNDIALELVGPLGCGLQTGAGAVMNSLKVQAGESIAIFGTGAVGLAAVMAARVVGAGPIIGVDINPSRLELAKELGATHTIDSRTEDVHQRIAEITGTGVDYVVEVTGRPEMMGLAVLVLAPLGTVAQVGGPPLGTKAPIDVNAMLVGGRSYRGVNQGDSVPQWFIPKLIAMYREGVFPFDRLLRFYDFGDINDAVEDTRSGEAIKPVLRMQHQ